MPRATRLLPCILLSWGCSGALDVGSNEQKVPELADQRRGTEPSAACADLGAEPVALSDESGDHTILRITPRGGTLWLSTMDASAPTGRSLWTIDVAKRARARVPLFRFDRQFAFAGNALAYVRKDGDRSSSLVIHDLATESERSLPPPGPTHKVIFLDDRGSGVVWASEDLEASGVATIHHLDRALTTVTMPDVLTLPDATNDDTDLYVVRYLPSEVRIEAIPLRGGANRVVTGGFEGNATIKIAGVSDRELFYAYGHLDEDGRLRGTLRAVRTDGSRERSVAGSMVFDPRVPDHTMKLDPERLYWPEDGATGSVAHVARAGGEVEHLQIPGGYTSFAVDRCNVYWGQLDPPVVHGRRRL